MARTPGSIKTSAPKQPPKDPRVQMALDAEDELLQALDVQREEMGPNLKKTMDRVHRDLIRLAGNSGKNKISDQVLETALYNLTAAQARDTAAEFQAPTAPSADAVRNWGKTTSIGTTQGKLQLTGSAAGESHPLNRLLGTLGIDPSNLTPNVADVIDNAAGRQIDLSNQGNWNKIARNLLLAKAEDGVKTPTKAAEVQATPSVVTGAVPKAEIDGSVTRNPELEASAPTTIGEGNRNNAIALLAQNLGVNQSQDRGKKGAVDDLAKTIAKDAGLENVTPRQLKEIKSILDAAMTDRSSADGSVRPSAVMLNAYQQLGEIEKAQTGDTGTYGMATAFAGAVHEAVKREETIPPHVDAVLNDLAASALTDLVGVKIAGKPMDPPAGLSAKLGSALASLKSGKAPEPPAAEKVADKTATDGVEDAARTETAQSAHVNQQAEITPHVQKLAADAMQAMGIEPNLPNAAPIKQAFEQIFARGESPKDVALNCSKWLDQLCGTNNSAKDAQLLSQIEDADTLQTFCTKGLQSVAMAAANPEQYKLQAQQHAAAASASGNNGAGGNGGFGLDGVPGGFGMPGVMGLGSPADADGSKNEVYLQRTIVINSILNDPSLSIEDKIFYFMMWFAAFADKEREQKMREIADLDRVDQQKKMMKDSIHREREALFQTRKELTKGLSSAEKEADRANPHMDKLDAAEKRLARLEQKPNAKPADLEKAKADVGRLRGLAKVDTPQHQELRKAHDELAALEKKGDAKPEELAAAKTKVAEAREKIPVTKADEAMAKVAAIKRQIADANGKIHEKSEQFDRLKNETQQAPKSRELLFMELERIQKFRGMLIDMANSFLRDMARRVKEIMQ